MKTPRRSLLLVLPVLALSLAACGGPPEGDVATISTDNGSQNISQAQYDRFFKAALSQSQQKPVAQVTPLVAPDFKACVAAAKAAIPKDSQRKTADAKLKETCQKQYDTVSDQAMQQLVNLNWIKAEAARRGINFRKAELNRELQGIITQQFQGQKGYEAFLKQSGFTQEDIDLNVLAQIGQTKIIAELQKQDGTPTDAEVKRYFEQKKATYVQPETRDLRLIKAKNEADAAAAKAALESGQSWTDVAKKYSTDAATKDQGGKVLATTADQQPPEFAKDVFKAKAGEMLGPIKTSLGYYIVKVQNVNAEKQPDFAQLKAQLAQSLQQENQQKTVDSFRSLFLARWAARTACASDYNDLVACGGTSATATTPKGTPPPGAGVPQFPTPKADPAAALDPAAGAGAAQQVQQAPTQ